MSNTGGAVVEWECCIKHPEVGAAEGAVFTRDHIIRVTERAFDDLGVACELVCIVFDQLGGFLKIGFDQLDS